jgi:outer membrane immunogenic protein
VGVQAGYHSSGGDSTLQLLPDLAAWTIGDPAYAQFHGRYDGAPNGWIGGVQLGLNWQSQSIVLGFEADIARTDAETDSSRTATIFGLRTGSYLSQELDWLGTVRARIGLLPTPQQNILVYVTGGLAYGRTSTNHYFADLTNGSGFVGSSSDWDVGGVVGGGIDWALESGLSLKAEYLYYDLGDRLVGGAHFNNPAPPQYGADARYDINGQIIRLGINYQFGKL